MTLSMTKKNFLTTTNADWTCNLSKELSMCLILTLESHVAPMFDVLDSS